MIWLISAIVLVFFGGVFIAFAEGFEAEIRRRSQTRRILSAQRKAGCRR